VARERRREGAGRGPDRADRRQTSAGRDADLRRAAHGEATALAWDDIDLANGRISVRDAKTEAGVRLVDILPALRDELTAHRYSAGDPDPDSLVFPTSSGSRRDKDNARERVIRPVVAAAEALLAARGHPGLPTGLTAHKLRHTFASILYVRGEDPPLVMSQLGHTDAGFTLRVYAHAMRRDEGDKERLKALVEGLDWHDWAPAPRIGRWRPPRRPPSNTKKPPQMRGFLTMGAAGFEPATSRV
jgi:integrase